MVNNTIHFEALVTETKTILKTLYYMPKLKTPYVIPINKKCGRDNIYSILLDECLNVDDYDIVQDSVSTLGIFKLSSDMYAMSDCHRIGLKSFDNAYLIIELFNAEIREQNS